MAQTIKASELVEDFDLYPRHDVDSTHVNSLAQSLEAGNTLPPIIACRKTKRIADGFHRRRAHIRVYGEDAIVPVEFKTYKTEGELYADAMRFNSMHGRRLTPVDYVRAATRGKALGLDDLTIAQCLHCTPDRVEKLVVGRTATCGNTTVPLKQTIRHMAGQKLTKKQSEANDKLGGMNAVFYVNQLVILIENNLLDTSNELLMAEIDRLGSLIEGLRVT